MAERTTVIKVAWDDHYEEHGDCWGPDENVDWGYVLRMGGLDADDVAVIRAEQVGWKFRGNPKGVVPLGIEGTGDDYEPVYVFHIGGSGTSG